MFNDMGSGDGWLWLLIIIVLLGGGNGLFGNARNGVMDGYVLNTDFATIERKLDGVNNGLCSGFFEQAQLSNGTNQIINNGFAQAELSRANAQANLMAQLYAMQSQNQQCCCQNRYDASNNTRDIIDAQRADTQAILAKLTCMENNAKDEKIADLTTKNQNLQFQISQNMQNSYLLNRLMPTPVPSYPVNSPYYYYGTTIA